MFHTPTFLRVHCVWPSQLLPSPPPRLHVGHVQPSPCSYSAQALMLHFWWLGITFRFFQSTPQPCPRHSGLTSLQSFPLFNLLKKPDCSAVLGGRSTPLVHKHIPCHTCDGYATQEMLSVVQVSKVTYFFHYT